MRKEEIVKKVLGNKTQSAKRAQGEAFASTNIALCKYWGKRNTELNLPMNSSLSIALPNLGTKTCLQYSDGSEDIVYLNGTQLEASSHFMVRLKVFLDLFREPLRAYRIEIQTNVPIAAGLASSACGFAALVKALDHFYGWELTPSALSILSRLGSGSASRSLWEGFVEWQEGVDPVGMDSYGIPLPEKWPDLCLAILMVNHKEKRLSSREGMQHTIQTSPAYGCWPMTAKRDIEDIKQAIRTFDFERLGMITESNALLMHAVMMAARPSILYAEPQTVAWMHQIWECRRRGTQIFFTQDAGPNLKLLFLKQDLSFVQEVFPGCTIIFPFLEKR